MPRLDPATLLGPPTIAGLLLAGSALAAEAPARTFANTVLLPDGTLMVWEVREATPEGAPGPSRITLGDPRKPMFLGQLKDRILGHPNRPPVRAVTRADEDATAPAFARDGKSVLFLSARGTGALPQVWEILLEGGEGDPVTDEPLGVREFVPAPGGSVVLLTGGELRRKAYGTPSELLLEVPANAADLALSWDGSRATFRGEHEDLWTIDMTTRESRRLTERPGVERSPCWSYDGATLYFLARLDPSRGDSIDGPFAIPASGASEPAHVTPRLPSHALELDSCADSDRLFAIVVAADGHAMVRIRPAEKKSQTLFSHRGKLHGLAVREDGEKMTFVVEDEGAPPEIASWDFPDDELTLLTALPPPEDESTSEPKGTTP